MTVNKAILIGNIGQDPELRTTGGGTQVCTLRLATSDREKVDGEWKDQTEWHAVVLFGKMAENAAKYLKKGSQVFIEGKNKTRKWKDKDGNDRYSHEIVASDMRFIGKRDGGGASSGGGRQERDEPRREAPAQTARPADDSPPFQDDDIPF